MSDTASAPTHPPVTDWVHDFDHTDPQWTDDPFPIWDQLRAACPVVHTDRFLGCYLPTSYEAVKQIAYDTEHFSSRRVIVRDVRPEITARAPPITSDPPEHKPAKQLLLPPFTPDAMKKLEPRVRAICNELIDDFIAEGKCDAAARYSRHIPVRAIAHMLGIPEKDGDLFIKWIHEILELGIKDDATLMRAVQEMTGYFAAHLEDRKKHPTDDLISALMRAKGPDGQPLEDGHVLGSLRLLLIAGIDTTWSAIGASLWHLAKTPSDRARLVAEPELMPIGGRGTAARLFAGDDGARGDEGDDGLPAARSRPATWCCCRSLPPTAIPRCSRMPTRWCSTARKTAMPPSASASTAASAPTSRAWRWWSRSRNG